MRYLPPPPSKDEAIALVRARAWGIEEEVCGHRGCEAHREVARKVIHTRAGGFGADWSLEAAEQFIRDADELLWVDSLLDHNLGVRGKGRVVCFDVPGPEAEGA